VVTALPEHEPFVLCEDSRGAGVAGPSFLFAGFRRAITADAGDDVLPALAAVRMALAQGAWVAGWIGFEAGYALEERLKPLLRPTPDWPLLWLGVFDRRVVLDPAALETLWRGPQATPEPGVLDPLKPLLDEAGHAGHVAALRDRILAGDVYQVNLTFPLDGRVDGNPPGLHRRLREAQRVGHGAVVRDDAGRWVLSYAPELFFSLNAGIIRNRPMKGTVARGGTPDEDAAAATWLAGDAKNRAENLMIVDLMRNDIARVAEPGSVRADALFAIESFASVHQMTSAVSGRLSPGRDAVDVLRALFPCGSVTGAPKIRAMELIAAHEARPRGVYTGAIGWFAPDGDAAFNVAIRTLAVDATGSARFGVGGGIVLDSVPAAEWRECAAKAAFLRDPPPPFDLIETFGWDGAAYAPSLDRHLARLAVSARRFGFALAMAAVHEALDAFMAHLPAVPCRVRLLVARSGAVCVQAAPLTPVPERPTLALARLPVAVDSPFLAHKTSHRRFYDDRRAHFAAATGCFEVAFVGEDGRLGEGSFTTLFVERDGMLLTPPLDAGVLPGVLRGELLASGRAREADLRIADLVNADRLLVGNALRGLIPVTLQRADGTLEPDASA